jgi:putative protein kinase ArgK-like GTPase of G3E family
VTTAATGDGVPALLEALDRRRTDGATTGPESARLARAEAQVWAILGERLRERLRDERHDAATRETLAAVADHRLDPYAAADELIGRLTAAR